MSPVRYLRLGQFLLGVHPRSCIPRATGAFRRSMHTPTRPIRHLRLGRITLASSLLLGGSLLVVSPPENHSTPLSTLLRSYIVYSMCSIPALVDYAPTILDTLMTSRIPFVKEVTQAVVRATFFAQFVGADTARETLPLLTSLRAENKGVLFAYSVEVDESHTSPSASSSGSSSHKEYVEEMIRSIDVAADFEDTHRQGRGRGRKTWVALKLTALLPTAESLINLSSYLIRTRPSSSPPVPFPGCPNSSDLDILYNGKEKGLSKADISALKELHEDLVRICKRAEERGVKVIIDAEYSWYQPAIDAFVYSLSRQFNKPSSSSFTFSQPLIYGTYQAYLRRTPSQLSASLADAKANGYTLGVKLVRGAYHPHEVARAHTSGEEVPVWSEKEDTDKCYNGCVKILLEELASSNPGKGWGLGILFGTHNWESCNLILNELLHLGLAVKEKEGKKIGIEEDVLEKVAVGQLYGMSDALTNSIVERVNSPSPFVIKYVPYGALQDVMPYLSRRAIENKSVLGDGGAAKERRDAGQAIWKRIFG